ncbi:MAG: hypothetical protein HN417_06230 [Desulfobacula sp.]|nr:hypothetical protein [Desulfobacula sp.]
MLIKNLFRYWTFQVFSPGTVLREKYESFKALLEHDKAAHEYMATLEDMYYSQKKHDFQAVVTTYEHLGHSVSKMVDELLKMCPSSNWSLKDYFKKFDFYNRFMLARPAFDFSPPFTIGFDTDESFNETITGKKAFSLFHLTQELALPIPIGFVITTNAFHYFLETNNLQKSINKLLSDLDINTSTSLEQTAKQIEQLIINAVVPEDIDIAVTNALNDLGHVKKDFRVALRSSAVKEDGKASFAGQYQTLLNVKKEDILNGYKQVIAGKYSSQALYYRVNQGILDSETPMAVLVLEMVDSKASGVMYTKDLENSKSQNLLIHSVWGQGELLVDGGVAPDVIKVSKNNPDTILSTKTSAKKNQTILEPGLSTRTVQTDSQTKDQLSLDEASALTLARWGVLLETHFNEPQDIEWCQDKRGRLFVLQSRPLNIHPAKIQDISEKTLSIPNNILCSKGETVCQGIGSGIVYRLEQLSQLPLIPKGSVVVVKQAPPQLVKAIHHMSAIIIETGSRASHFSSIAREFGVPAIVNVSHGFDALVSGSQVTVDADNCMVYEGIVNSLIKRSAPREDFFQDSSFMAKLRYVINFSAKLKLTDPNARSFVPEACRSLHDIIRFTHEMAVKEMFLSGNRKGSRKKGAKKLISNIPMLFYILDVGSGIKQVQKENDILKSEDITCIPMKALLKGLSHPGISWSETSHFDWEEYDRIVMAGGIISADSPQFGSYAVVSKEYLNVNFRFGYHFVILDTICSSIKEDNYILFRFSGGGGNPDGRMLRANFIKGILTRLGFMVEIKSDLVDAEFKNATLRSMEETLDVIGRLLGATKLMDMYLKENTQLELMIDDFMNGRYDFRSAVEEKG